LGTPFFFFFFFFLDQIEIFFFSFIKMFNTCINWVGVLQYIYSPK
jgi:hypothetical protein